MTYETKMARVRAMIEAFNASVPETGRVSVKAFEQKLLELGAATEATMAHVSWEDLQECGLPRLLARQVAEEMRGKEEGAEFLSQKKVDRMRFEQLLERYDPREDDSVARKLKDLSDGKRFIVFARGCAGLPGKVDQAASLRLLLELRHRLGEVTLTVDSNGLPAKTYKVGEMPNDELDENPVYPGRALRTGEMCDQTLRSWQGIPLWMRQLVYLAITQTHEVRVMNVGDAHTLIDHCLADTITATGKEIVVRWPRAVVLAKELEEKGQLPRLKVKVGEKVGGHPFYQTVTEEP